MGTDCTNVHIVPVPVTTRKDAVSLDDLDLTHWLDISCLQPTWVNLEERRHCFKDFSYDDMVPVFTEYVTCFEQQPVIPLPELRVNNYLNGVKGGYGQRWYGNMLIVKCRGHNRVEDIVLDNVALAKRCAAM